MRRNPAAIPLAALALLLAAAAPAAAAPQQDILVADATDVVFPDPGAIYRITAPGTLETVAYGPPLESPSGLLVDKAGLFVTDIGSFYDFFGLDGKVMVLPEGGVPVVIYAGDPLSNPFGMLRDGDLLLVADFGSPLTADDGALYELSLDPDGDGALGPFPLGPGDLRTVYWGLPIGGVNQIVPDRNGVLMADDTGSLFVLDPAAAVPLPQPFGPAFADPVGLGKMKKGWVVVDAMTNEVFQLDKNGVDLTLLLAGTLGVDQFLGVDVDRKDRIAMANAGVLDAVTGDGQVILLDQGSASVPYSGSPLLNPFSVAFARPPRSAGSVNSAR